MSAAYIGQGRRFVLRHPHWMRRTFVGAAVIALLAFGNAKMGADQAAPPPAPTTQKPAPTTPKPAPTPAKPAPTTQKPAPAPQKPAAAPRPTAAADAATIEDFQKRLKEYVQMHKKFEGMLPNLPKEATPEQIDKHQRALGQLIENGRRTAKQGDVFTPAMQVIARRELGRIFGGPEGKQLKASIMDENPVTVTLRVNSRYPSEVPISTMPPEVLGVLPKLEEELQYRFVGDRLIMVDQHADIVVDYIDNALPK